MDKKTQPKQVKPTTVTKALSRWHKQHKDSSPQEAEKICLIMEIPLIEKIEPLAISQLHKCVHLSFSTNNIDKIPQMPPLRNLKILSLSRNRIKHIKGLEEIGDNLEQLWISYNKIDSLSHLNVCRKLEVLYISNNQISKWDEIDKLKDLTKINKVLFKGNPIYNE